MVCKFLNMKWAIGIAVLLALVGCGRGSQSQGMKGSDGAASAAAPEASLEIPSLDGASVSIDHYKGKVVLVNFWATWCAPCRMEIPWLIEFNQKYGPKGLVILGVAMDDEGNKVVQPWVQKPAFRRERSSGADELSDPARQHQRSLTNLAAFWVCRQACSILATERKSRRSSV